LRERLMLLFALAIALVACALGAYAGWVTEAPTVERFRFPVLVALYGALFGAWFIALPFAQAWARRGTWRVSYADLFEFSWQNALLLLEAALFTGVFWLVLLLWAQLFKVVNITFFVELFAKPVFAYPVSAIVFGYAIYLVESHEKIVITLRRHLLGVFSWLLPVVALLAVAFMLVLPFTGLEPLWKTGQATALMLWLQVAFIHFINSAYEDGQAEPRYPAWLKLALRAAVFTLPIYAVLCAYSLGLRVEQYGWTVSRVWAAIATVIAALYGLGYVWAALRRSPWLGEIARVNVAMAAVVAALLLIATSPLLDPKRISADSQAARLRSGAVAAAKFDYDYLRFELGRHGNDLLNQLAKGPDKEAATLASATLAKTHRYHQLETVPPEQVASRIQLYPAGASLDPAFVAYLEAALKERQSYLHPQCLRVATQERCLMLAVDLNEDGQAEIVAIKAHPQAVYSRAGGKWRRIGVLVGGQEHWRRVDALVREAPIKTERPAWRDVLVGDVRYTVTVTP
jgi:hypothetical protein